MAEEDSPMSRSDEDFRRGHKRPTTSRKETSQESLVRENLLQVLEYSKG